MNKDVTLKVLEWVATFFVITASATLSFDYPFLSTILFFVGSLVWVVVAALWRKSSLAVTNLFIALVYIAGWTGTAEYVKTLF